MDLSKALESCSLIQPFKTSQKMYVGLSSSVCYVRYADLDGVLLVNFSEELFNDAVSSPNHKTCFSFALKCL